MRIFISWSGDAARQCAEALNKWLRLINSEIKPFVSSRDISKGDRPMDKIAATLQDSHFGIVCLTRDNQMERWINFEAGALSKDLTKASLIPFLIDMPIKELSGPLKHFQATDASSKEDVLFMVESINDKCVNKLDKEQLKIAFDAFWGGMENDLRVIRETEPPAETPKRETSDILDELVGLVRDQSERISALEKKLIGAGTAPALLPKATPDVGAVSHTAAKAAVRTTMTSLEVSGIVGSDHVLESHVDSDGVVVLCDGEGFRRASEQYEKLQRLAVRNQVPISILHESESVVFPPR
ncbi:MULTISPECIES: toll/interleukin-1 receptor domain-containing protein [unclassified Streptomyces]|uniref:toll/interleukin-1 receptor domain-containing protein n=1 Tax=unclassified Streptomyces TaxID=2593676 RepID=UPI002E3444E0|nr:toll/interleukin-1 receptor domain-containing protein [Streptomyces sp. NBC_01268]